MHMMLNFFSVQVFARRGFWKPHRTVTFLRPRRRSAPHRFVMFGKNSHRTHCGTRDYQVVSKIVPTVVSHSGSGLCLPQQKTFKNRTVPAFSSRCVSEKTRGVMSLVFYSTLLPRQERHIFGVEWRRTNAQPEGGGLGGIVELVYPRTGTAFLTKSLVPSADTASSGQGFPPGAFFLLKSTPTGGDPPLPGGYIGHTLNLGWGVVVGGVV